MDALKSESIDLPARLELELRIRDGARNMLQILDAGEPNEALRSQVERELAVAEEQVQNLHKRRQSIEDTLRKATNESSMLPASSRFCRPRAIRAVHGLEDLNAHGRVSGASPDPFTLPESEAFRLPSHDLDQSIRVAQILLQVLKTMLVPHSCAPPSEVAHVFMFLSNLYCHAPTLRFESSVHTLFLYTLDGISQGATSTVRAYALRLLRYIQGPDVLPQLASYSNACTVFLSRALTLEDAYEFEREQALKLVRSWMHYTRLGNQHAHALLTEGIVRVLAAIALEPDDALSQVCVETLAELVVLDTPLVARSSAIAPIWRAVCDTRAEKAVALVTVFFGLLDRPSTRRHIHAGTDLESVLAAFTTVPSTSETLERLMSTQHVVSHMLQSWQGLFHLCTRDMGALRAIIAALHMDDDAIRTHILAALISVFYSPATLPRKPCFDVRVSYMSLVLVLLLDAGLYDALLSIVQHAPAHREQASKLLMRALHFSREVLPKTHAVLCAFPELVRTMCVPCEHSSDIVGASNALEAIDRCESVQDAPASKSVFPPYADVPMDDAQFRSMLRESIVVVAREHTAWNQSVILDLLDGPLWDPRRFDEALFGTKFVRRLLSFFRPSHTRYVSMKKGEAAQRWTRIGMKLCRVMLHHMDGVRTLVEERFLTDLRDAFEQIAQPVPDMLFSQANLQHTAAGGYFDMLQVFSESTTGLELLSHTRMFSCWLALCDHDDDVSIQVLCMLVYVLDFSQLSFARVLLERALTSAPDAVRLAATKRLAQVLWLDDEPQGWAMSLLLAQLHDPNIHVQHAATSELEKACDDPAMAQCAMQQGPPIDLLARNSKLALLGLAAPRGFHAMHRAGLLNTLAQVWYAHEHLAYVAHAEHVLSPRTPLTILPPHLYGQLARTSAGCVYLNDMHILPELHSVLASHAREAFDLALLERVKAALWACGHIGASNSGMELLTSHGLLDMMLCAAKSPVVSVRGTVFFMCGLLAQSEHGRDAIATYGWESSAFVCLPCNRHTFVSMPTLTMLPAMHHSLGSRLAPPRDKHEAHVAGLMANLGNGVVAGSARRALLRQKQQNPALFQQTSVLGRALHMMDHFAIRLAARRSVWSLFDECKLSLDTVKALQQWRSANVATAPSIPARRSQTTQHAHDDEAQHDIRLYPVPFVAMRHKNGARHGMHNDAAKPAWVFTSKQAHMPSSTTTYPPPPLAVPGKAARHAWPYTVHGFE